MNAVLNRIVIVAFLASGIGGGVWALTVPSDKVHSPEAKAPVVVELFQSQGCSDCPPAQANLNALSDRSDVLALSYGVTYWDSLGWKDSFASPQFTDRQRAYSRGNGGSAVATPQFWINGRTTILGSNPARVAHVVAQGGPTYGPVIRLASGKVTIDAGMAAAGGADVWLVRYDPRTIKVAIRAGENGGRVLPHRDIVRELRRIGFWTGTALTLPIPPAHMAGLKMAILLQGTSGGPILSAVKG